MLKRILIAVLVAAGLAVCSPAAADEYIIAPDAVITLPTCSGAGGVSVSVPEGAYLLIGSGEEGRLCFGETCATGGMIVHVGTRDIIHVGRTRPVSCRSVNGLATIQLVPATRRR